MSKLKFKKGDLVIVTGDEGNTFHEIPRDHLAFIDCYEEDDDEYIVEYNNIFWLVSSQDIDNGEKVKNPKAKKSKGEKKTKLLSITKALKYLTLKHGVDYRFELGVDGGGNFSPYVGDKISYSFDTENERKSILIGLEEEAKLYRKEMNQKLKEIE